MSFLDGLEGALVSLCVLVAHRPLRSGWSGDCTQPWHGLCTCAVAHRNSLQAGHRASKSDFPRNHLPFIMQKARPGLCLRGARGGGGGAERGVKRGCNSAYWHQESGFSSHAGDSKTVGGHWGLDSSGRGGIESHPRREGGGGTTPHSGAGLSYTQPWNMMSCTSEDDGTGCCIRTRFTKAVYFVHMVLQYVALAHVQWCRTGFRGQTGKRRCAQ